MTADHWCRDAGRNGGRISDRKTPFVGALGHVEDAVTSTEAAALAELVRALLPGSELTEHFPPPATGLEVRPARIDPPASVARLSSTDGADRVAHAHGEAFQAVVRARFLAPVPVGPPIRVSLTVGAAPQGGGTKVEKSLGMAAELSGSARPACRIQMIVSSVDWPRRRIGSAEPATTSQPLIRGGAMLRTMLKSKIHRATVTRADLHYVGSLTLDRNLLDAADLLPGELVHVVDINNGARLQTYVLEGAAGSGEVGINGAAARLIQPGDLVIVIAYGLLADDDAKKYVPNIVFVDAHNRIVDAHQVHLDQLRTRPDI